MKLRIAIAAFVAALPPAFAGEVACPDLSAAVQVMPCPSEEELQYTFKGYCSDNARMFAKGEEMDHCVSYENYRKVKNIALWEAGGGAFQGYVSCGLDPAAVRAAKVQGITVGKAGKVTRIACDYGQGIVFAHRTRGECKAAGEGFRAVCD